MVDIFSLRYMYMYFYMCNESTIFLCVASNLRNEMENAAVRLKYLEEAHTTVQQDIALTVRATEKTVSDVSKAQEDKLKQVREGGREERLYWCMGKGDCNYMLVHIHNTCTCLYMIAFIIKVELLVPRRHMY